MGSNGLCVFVDCLAVQIVFTLVGGVGRGGLAPACESSLDVQAIRPKLSIIMVDKDAVNLSWDTYPPGEIASEISGEILATSIELQVRSQIRIGLLSEKYCLDVG